MSETFLFLIPQATLCDVLLVCRSKSILAWKPVFGRIWNLANFENLAPSHWLPDAANSAQILHPRPHMPRLTPRDNHDRPS